MIFYDIQVISASLSAPKLELEEFRLFCFHGRELAHKPIRKQKADVSEADKLWL